MFSGKTPIPLETLIDLSLAIGFDPREVRPEIDSILNKLLLAIKGVDNQNLKADLKALSPEARKEVQNLIKACQDIQP